MPEREKVYNMDSRFMVTYKRGNLVWRSEMTVFEVVGMFNKGMYEILDIVDLQVDETINDIMDSFEHNDSGYFLAIWDKDKGMTGIDLDLTTFEYILDKVKDDEITVLSWFTT